MKTDFEKEIEQVMTEEKEMPMTVRRSLDSAYTSIRTQSKKKKSRFIWKRVTAAACALLITGVVLTNEHVIASIHDFFTFGDKGIERAINEGFVQESASTATDQQIVITLQRHFSDANKIGLGFQLEFEDPTILADVISVSMNFRLKNGDGEYIIEFIPDTKPLKGNGGYASGLDHQNPLLDVKNGVVQYDVIMNSNKGEFPNLKDAVVEVEGIVGLLDHEGKDFINRDLPIIKIEGKWDLSVANQDISNPMPIIEYDIDDPSSIIQVSSAKASPTSLNLIFSVDEIYADESPFSHTMKILDMAGNEYLTDGYNMTRKDNQTIISANFEITSYDNAEKLTFVIEGIGEVDLLRK
ncbi:DUF4179 domain-containing protein [Sporosarcina sp. NPDC096371]|uniref:DUF4179 domain-containing protein n=1 Tax=Sporosarcina sp. NPDC096371 TaxID=3364530 RepID=UPI0038234F86